MPSFLNGLFVFVAEWFIVALIFSAGVIVGALWATRKRK